MDRDDDRHRWFAHGYAVGSVDSASEPGRRDPIDRFDAIFKAYDVRGRVDTGDLDEEVAERIGAGFARYVDAPVVAVGRDCRTSSPSLAAAFIDGVNSQGVDVVDLGLVPTEVLYFHSGNRSMPGAVVTASHNPAGYNGFKMCHRGAAPVGMGTGLDRIKHLARTGEVSRTRVRGRVSNHDAIPEYIDHLFAIVEPTGIGPLRVVADGGNGMAGLVVGGLFDCLSANLAGLYLEPDGTFPNHPADPLDRDNLDDLVQMVRSQEADAGVAFDGDADRAVFVDGEGEPLSGSVTTSVIASWYLGRRPGARIVHNLICSKAVSETIRAAGGVPVRTRVGHSFIKGVMADTGAVFGGEHSGHYYFRDNYGADSGMLAMLVLLTVLTEAGLPLSELRRAHEPYAMSGEINHVVPDAAASIEEVASAFPGHLQDRLDGLTVDLGDRWFNLRPSNTEPLLRLNVEAPDRDSVDELAAAVIDVISA